MKLGKSFEGRQFWLAKHSEKARTFRIEHSGDGEKAANLWCGGDDDGRSILVFHCYWDDSPTAQAIAERTPDAGGTWPITAAEVEAITTESSDGADVRFCRERNYPLDQWKSFLAYQQGRESTLPRGLSFAEWRAEQKEAHNA